MKPTELEQLAEDHVSTLYIIGVSDVIIEAKKASFKQGFEKAISQMQPEWVAVEDELPGDEIYAIIWRKGYSPEETVARLTKHHTFNVLCFIDNSMNIYKIGDSVTHWKPLSQPPIK